MGQPRVSSSAVVLVLVLFPSCRASPLGREAEAAAGGQGVVLHVEGVKVGAGAPAMTVGVSWPLDSEMGWTGLLGLMDGRALLHPSVHGNWILLRVGSSRAEGYLYCSHPDIFCIIF